MHTEATNISKLFQCARVFGGIAKTSLIGGTVVEVLLGKTKTQGNKTGLRVRWAWLSKDVETVQGRRRVRTGPPPRAGTPPGESEPGGRVARLAAVPATSRRGPDSDRVIPS